MPETTAAPVRMAIDLKKNRLRIHKATLRLLGNPAYVKLLFNTKQQAIAVVRCERNQPRGEEIPVAYDKPGNAGTFDIYSKELVGVIRAAYGGLDKTGLYRLDGYPVPEENGVLFPISTLRRAEGTHV